jgi:hypothetical protein
MIERMVYLAGVAAAVVSWLIAQLVADLTSVATLYQKGETARVEGGKNSISRTTFEIINLSRSQAIKNFTVHVRGQDDRCSVADQNVFPVGLEWNLIKPVQSGQIEVPSLMPGSSLRIGVEQPANCKPDFTFELDKATGADGKPAAVRIITDSLESLVLFNWLWIIAGLLCAAALVYFVALAIAVLRSLINDRGNPRLKKAQAEAEMAEAEAKKSEAEVRRIDADAKKAGHHVDNNGIKNPQLLGK